MFRDISHVEAVCDKCQAYCEAWEEDEYKAGGCARREGWFVDVDEGVCLCRKCRRGMTQKDLRAFVATESKAKFGGG